MRKRGNLRKLYGNACDVEDNENYLIYSGRIYRGIVVTLLSKGMRKYEHP